MSTHWLPELLLLEHSKGDWNHYLDQLHARFKADFIESRPAWPGKRVAVKRHPETAGKTATFWHLISDGAIEDERVPDMRRCERIGWPRPMMDEFDESNPAHGARRIVWWKESRGREERYVLAPEDFSYIVVVADRGDYVLPWTAFCVEYDHQRSKRERAFRTFWQAKKG